MSIDDISNAIAQKLRNLGAGNFSRHLDELCEELPNEIISYDGAVNLFTKVKDALRSGGEIRSIIMTIPLQFSSEILLYDAMIIESLKCEIVMPTFYIYNSLDIFSEAHEDYRRSLPSPDASNETFMIYRSWRDGNAAENGWEFNNDIYLWSVLNHETPVPVN